MSRSTHTHRTMQMLIPKWIPYCRLVLLLVLLCYAGPAMAEGPSVPQTSALQNTLSSAMRDNGITLGLTYIGETVRKFSGGLNQRNTIYQDNLDLTATIDTDKLLSWPGGTLFIHGLRNHGGNPSVDLVGDLQGVSNIEAPDQFTLYELWYEQRFAHDRASLLFGLRDMNSEFYVSDYAALFLNSSFGIGPEISLNVTSSVFPKAGLGIRARVRPLQNWYIQGGVYDGDPATRKPSSKVKGVEGKMAIVESGFSSASGTYKTGYWHHTANKSYNNRTFDSDYGIYAVIDQQLLRFEGSTAIGGFVQWGWVPKARNDVTGYLGLGLHVQAPLPGRDDDELGIALARASTHTSAETTVEATYRIAINPWIAIQPSLQWIRHPGGDPTAKAARVGLLRFQVTM